MKTLIVYYSLTGNCKYIADKIGEIIECDVLRIYPVKGVPQGARRFYWGGKSALMQETPELKPYEFNESEYGQIILGFPVWAVSMAPPLRSFIKENKKILNGKKVAAYTSHSMFGAGKALDKVEELLGQQLTERLSLIDPKDKKKSSDDQKIEQFCVNLDASDINPRAL